MKDLREYLKKLKEEHPEEVIETDDSLSSQLEIPALLWDLEDKGEFPAVLINNPKDVEDRECDYRLLTNLFAKRARQAYALGTTVENAGLYYHKLEENKKEPKIISEENAPVKENIETGDVDISRLPIIYHHEADSAPFITAGIGVTKGYGEYSNCGYNAAYLRMEYKDQDKTGIMMLPKRHTDLYFEEYEKDEKDMPIATVIGHHPTFNLGSITLQSIDEDEYEAIGGVMESPLELTPSETWGGDFMVPANAEIVIEGVVKAGVREPDGPFGEYTRYMGEVKDNSKEIEVKAVTHRDNAIYHDIFAAHRDHFLAGHLPIEGKVYETVKQSVPSVKNVHMPPSGNCRHHSYIQINKNSPGQAKNAIIAALTSYDVIKHVVVVDEDVDIFNEDEVLWAIATRSQWGKDLVLISDNATISLDPSAKNYEISDRGGIDATKEFKKDFPETVKPSQDVKVDSGKYLNP